jgi:hypothetical protein
VTRTELPSGDVESLASPEAARPPRESSTTRIRRGIARRVALARRRGTRALQRLVSNALHL